MKRIQENNRRSPAARVLGPDDLDSVQGGHICCDPGEECPADITPEDCMPNPAPEPEEEPSDLVARRTQTPYDHSLDR